MRRLLLAAAILSIAGAAPALAQTSPSQAADPAAVFHATTLNLSATGEVRVVPDLATINTGVTVQALVAADAMRANAGKMNAVIAALRTAGIAERDIQTSSLSLDAQYNYTQNQPRRLTGYQASNTVTITVRDLSRLGATVDAVVQSGANEINGIAFDVASPQASEDQARRAAVKALAAKAALYAEATGYKVTRLVSLSESGGYAPSQPRPLAMARMVAAEPPTPVAAGEMRIRIDVSGVYELGR